MKNRNARYAVVLAGGVGSRFWPQSRTLEPKQFLRLERDKSLFRRSLERIHSLVPVKNIYIVASPLYGDIIRSETALFNIPLSNLIFEPSPKNTAPAIALAVKIIFDRCRDENAGVAVLPCDQLITNTSRFFLLMRRAFSNCRDRFIVFGIPPHRPATGYGYIKASSKGGFGPGNTLRLVEKFCEKPDVRTAKRFLRQGSYFWNSGIFVGSVGVFLSAIHAHLPMLFKQVSAAAGSVGEKGLVSWNKIRPVSFDYGVMEKTKNIAMIPADRLGWSDLGSWQAWDELQRKDKNNNLLLADIVDIDSHDLTVLGREHLIATIGLKGLIVVDTPDALFIADKKKSEDVKRVVEILKKNKREEHFCHITVKRPWGAYTVLETGPGFKIKLVEVLPGKSLSLQLHRKRSEHWVVIQGQAIVTNGKGRFRVRRNESTFIPRGYRHRLENREKTILKIVEVQTGASLTESDIVRFQDSFGRTKPHRFILKS
ncbi:MAG: mannose-1-phosphate guanylyltransferase/mannose-6-phosphate isomerase [Candidatus Velamenicoccus archaeovorus]